MKFLVRILMVGALVLSLLAGCNTSSIPKSGKGTVNSTYSQTSMKTYSGGDFILDDTLSTFYNESVGMGITYTEQMKNLMTEGLVGGSMVRPYYVVLSGASAQLENLTKDKDLTALTTEEQEALVAEMEKYIMDLVGVFRKPKNDVIAEEEFATWSGLFSKVEQLETLGNDTYYWGYNESLGEKNYTDEEKEKLNALLADVNTFRDGICIFPYRDTRNTEVAGPLGEFSAKTLTGETITQDVFKDYDLTVINVWGLECEPCILDMPYLQKLAGDLPKNVNLISLNVDGEDFQEQVKTLCDEKKITYPVLFADENLKQNLLMQLSALPTTVFVDKDGNIRGDFTMGSFGQTEQRVLAGYNQLIQLHLSAINGKK